MVDGDTLAGLEQVQRHRRAHVAERDETDFHLSILLPETTLNARIGGSIWVLTDVNLAVHGDLVSLPGSHHVRKLHALKKSLVQAGNTSTRLSVNMKSPQMKWCIVSKAVVKDLGRLLKMS